MTADDPIKRGPGQPRIGARYQVVLDDASVATLRALGRGNLSAGVREAARRVADERSSAASTPAPANSRVLQGYAYRDPLDRPAYEDACRALGVDAMSDADVSSSYGVRFGDFSYPAYQPDVIVQMHLARLRQQHIDDKRSATEADRPPAIAATPKMLGQLWEPCERCGREPVYMPLHVCAACWPKAAA